MLRSAWRGLVVGVGERGPGVDDDHAADQIGRGRREPVRDEAAEAVADDDRLVEVVASGCSGRAPCARSPRAGRLDRPCGPRTRRASSTWVSTPRRRGARPCRPTPRPGSRGPGMKMIGRPWPLTVDDERARTKPAGVAKRMAARRRRDRVVVIRGRARGDRGEHTQHAEHQAATRWTWFLDVDLNLNLNPTVGVVIDARPLGSARRQRLGGCHVW